MNFEKNNKQSYINLSNCIRVLAAEAVEKARSGHPGMPLGMADCMTVLAKDFLRFHPHNPKWPGRDRLVLSAGHGSMLLYAFYYLAGYRNFTLDDIKNFRQLGAKTPGHPEYGIYEAVETTTGPLGQGLAASVGMAIAGMKYMAHLGKEIAGYKVYCIVGDGCLMEGISYEAASLAGHLGLNNLIVLFDDNQISIDGRTDLSVSEDHLAGFRALGWQAEGVDGHDFQQIKMALERAGSASGPYFIALRTNIAKGARLKEGSEEAHGAPLGSEEIAHLKENTGFVGEPFWLPDNLISVWREMWRRNEGYYNDWETNFSSLKEEQKSYLTSDNLPKIDFCKQIELSEKAEATRASSGKMVRMLIEGYDKVICGSADLSISTNIKSANSRVINREDFSGNYLHYGVREHAMAAIMNGLALSGFLPVGGTFFVFSDYMKPAIRLAALMHRQVIYLMTHDSIGVGEDGPTHQPVEHLAAVRSIPNLLVLRPADVVETAECWQLALENTTGPSMLVLTRQNVPQIRRVAPAENPCARGAYLVRGGLEDSDLLIFASGSEVSLALEVARLIEGSISSAVVSVPSFELFFKQSPEYISRLLDNNKRKIAIEAGSSFGWHRIIGREGLFFGLDAFGISAPGAEVYKHFGLTAENIAEKILNLIPVRGA